MKILGIIWELTSSSCIMIDNKIVYASSEERFSRKKSDESFPIMSINNGLEYCGLKRGDIDNVVVGGKEFPLDYAMIHPYSSFTVQDHLITMEKYWRPKLRGEAYTDLIELFKHKIDKNRFPFNTELMKYFPEKFDLHDFTRDIIKESQKFIKKAISQCVDVDETKIEFFDQHSCHAAYAFYASPIRKDGTLIFTADSYGDGLSGTISKYNSKNKKIVRLKSYSANQMQIARIYRLITLLLRMLPSEHEYKVMGLAPYYTGSKSLEVKSILDDMQSLMGTDFKFNESIKNIFDHLEEKLKSYRFDHIAAGVQLFTEDLLYNWISNAIEEFGGDSIVFSGGISMNIKANMKIMEIPKLKDFFVVGAGTDQSLAIGACYLKSEQMDHGMEIPPLESLYLGTESTYTEKQIEQISDKYIISEFTDVKQIVDRILDGKIIATCLGRSEFGPRALGNRSILADPRKQRNIEIINHKIKNRDFWMPFAPVILSEYQNEIILNPKGIRSPHMTVGFETKNGKEVIPAAIHPADGTVRPMILEKEHNPLLWDLLYLFYKKTGVPVLLNTSFNLHGEPIVDNLEQAIRVLDNSGIDTLWISGHIIDKK